MAIFIPGSTGLQSIKCNDGEEHSDLRNVFCYSLQVVSDAMLAELKQCFMEAYDDNQDGKIDIREV